MLWKRVNTDCQLERIKSHQTQPMCIPVKHVIYLIEVERGPRLTIPQPLTLGLRRNLSKQGQPSVFALWLQMPCVQLLQFPSLVTFQQDRLKPQTERWKKCFLHQTALVRVFQHSNRKEKKTTNSMKTKFSVSV